jgi:mono/diheme cytochrome c family protein
MNRQGHHEQTSPWARTAPGPASFVLLSVLAAAALANSASASPASIERGRRLAEAHCKTCHALTGDKPGPVAGAPPFAEIQNRAPGRSLDEIFAGALASGHPPMPRFVGSPEQQQDLLDYIRSRQTAAPTR